MTSVPGIFSCGNVLHIHDVADWASFEGFAAGERAARVRGGGQAVRGEDRPDLAGAERPVRPAADRHGGARPASSGASGSTGPVANVRIEVTGTATPARPMPAGNSAAFCRRSSRRSRSRRRRRRGPRGGLP
ncbi:MAG: hypothetical protein MZV64_18175 [Ignavibacteriales bacterium]|nr:hypothetical protein [Ignavibacteriales bacterium]